MPENNREIAGSPDLVRLLTAADECADAAGSEQTGPEHVLFALLRDPTMIPTERLRGIGMEPDFLFARLAEFAKAWRPDRPARAGV